MVGFFSRLFKTGEARAPADKAPPSLRAQIEALQSAYWELDAREVETQLAIPREQLNWREALRLHHLLCIHRAQSGELHPRHPELILHLCAANSPYRPRHAFVWEGDGPPEGEDIPYSTHQGRLANAALSHLASLEVVTLDAQLRPEALEFIPFDEVMTVAASPVEDIRGGRLLLEYGRGERIVLLADHYAELVHDDYIQAPELADTKLPAPLASTQLLGGGPQRLRRLSDFAAEGLAEFELQACYQISLAIEAEDPRFEQKCRGRELDPATMRADLQREQQGRRDGQEKKLRLRTL